MKVGLLAPPWIPLPPPSYGGIEIVVSELAEGLAENGHDVTILAAPGSKIRGVETVSVLRELPSLIGEPHAERAHIRAAREVLGDCDVVIDHSGPTGALACSELGVPSAHVVHGPLNDEVRGIYRGLSRGAPTLKLISISRAQRRAAPELPWIATCHNGLDISAVPFSAEPGGYLAFLGRVCPEKGLPQAMDIAAVAGVPLWIAAKCREPEEHAYFDEFVAPRLGENVRWLGEIGQDDKYRLLHGAMGLVFAIQWEEPFGLVMIESMATGTPVLATPRGSVPEIVGHGTTGFVSADLEQLARFVPAMREIDRRGCREHVAEHFSRTAMTTAYEQVIADLRRTARRRTTLARNTAVRRLSASPSSRVA